MRIRSLMLFAAIFLITDGIEAQTKVYKDMSRAERLEFVGTQARRIAREMSGKDYEFTQAFEADIQKAVTRYAERIGAPAGKTDLRVVLERAQAQAALINATFRGRQISPIFGLYLPFIESEYVNIPSSKPVGAVGMFQFLPETGQRLGLSAQDLLDVGKSADAAARYIADSMEVFKGDPMKEALAVLSYNRGAQKVSRELKVVLNDQNKQCSICALTAERSKLDETFRSESVFYVPIFFAAAIIGENPQSFELQMPPLSSH
ncbi:MAG TPA: transglycosylase SLT domain-containing protein [Pyrinomonadaceae bacterium]|nr:transglycosylase SLT domain-containing protein [Pyrinomonadaceae bacterium]